MNYVCIHCGHHFTEPHNRYNRRWSDSDESEQYCPNCGSEDFEEAGHCIKCDEDFPLEQMVVSICRGCVEKAQTFDNALRYGADRKESVEINGFLAWAFTTSDIEEILTNVLRIEAGHEVGKEDAHKYLSDDIYDFSEWLEAQDD